MKNTHCPYDPRVVCGYLETSHPASLTTITYACADCPRHNNKIADTPRNTRLFDVLIPTIVAIGIIGALAFAIHTAIIYFRP